MPREASCRGPAAKDHAHQRRFEGRVEFGKDYKPSAGSCNNPPEDAGLERRVTLIPKGKHIIVCRKATEDSMSGAIPADCEPPGDLRLRHATHTGGAGVEAQADYLVNGIQDVYRLQAVKNNDKTHRRVIAARMLAEGRSDGAATRRCWSARCSTTNEEDYRRREREGRQGERIPHRGERPSPPRANAGPAGHQPRRACRPSLSISSGIVPETTQVLTEAPFPARGRRTETAPEGESHRRRESPLGNRRFSAWSLRALRADPAERAEGRGRARRQRKGVD